MTDANSLLVLSQFLEDLSSYNNSFLKIDNNGIAYTKEDITSIVSALTNHINNHIDQINFLKVNDMDLDAFKSKIFNDLHHHEHTNSSVLDTITIEIINKYDNKQDALGYTPLDVNKKGAADGYVPLNATSKVNESYFPDSYHPTRPYKVVDTKEQLLALTDSNICDIVYVIDDDSNIPGEQSACYICTKKTPLTFIRYISIDNSGATVSTNWNDISNRPTSTITDIDDAVSKKHNHSNINVIDKLNEDTNTSNLTYNGKYIHTIHDKKYDYSLAYIGNDGSNLIKEVTVTSTTKSIVYMSMYYQGLRLSKDVHYSYDDTSKKVTFINGFYLPPAPNTQPDNMIRLFYVTEKDQLISSSHIMTTCAG